MNSPRTNISPPLLLNIRKIRVADTNRLWQLAEEAFISAANRQPELRR